MKEINSMTEQFPLPFKKLSYVLTRTLSPGASVTNQSFPMCMFNLFKQLLTFSRYSGACTLLTYVMGNHLFVANAGDCRAILGRRKKGDQHEEFEAIQITKDHTAYEEEERIK
jgi:hypothetical protein